MGVKNRRLFKNYAEFHDVNKNNRKSQTTQKHRPKIVHSSQKKNKTTQIIAPQFEYLSDKELNKMLHMCVNYDISKELLYVTL